MLKFIAIGDPIVCVKVWRKDFMMNKNNFILLLMILFGWDSCCMDLDVVKKSEDQSLYFTVALFQNLLMSYLTVQSLGRFARTCRSYAAIFDPAKIITTYKSCFEKIEDNFYHSTHALSRFALYKNKALFDRLWEYDDTMRNKYMSGLCSSLKIDFSNNIDMYQRYYKDSEEVDQRIADQLQDAIMNKDGDSIVVILDSKKYDIFKLFDENKIETAFKNMCELNAGEVDDLLQLLPEESGENKNKAVQYICKYDTTNILLALLKKNYLKVDEKYGNEYTLSHYAVLSASPKLIMKLCERGVELHNLHNINIGEKDSLDYAENIRMTKRFLCFFDVQSSVD